MTAPRDIRLLLGDIVESAEKVEWLATRGRDRFDADWKTHDLIVHHLEIMGEAASALPLEFRDLYAEIRWGALIGMRNHLIHGYAGINYDIVWEAATVHCAPMRCRIRTILDELED